MNSRSLLGNGSLRLALAGLMALSIAGCGLGKVVDDAVQLVEIVVENPELDKDIVRFAGSLAAAVVWTVVNDGVHAVVHGRSGSTYVVKPLDSTGSTGSRAMAIYRLPADGSDPVPLVEDHSIVAFSIEPGILYWICDDGASKKRVMAMPIQD